jgi:integrase
MRLYGTGSLWLRKSKKHPEGEYWLRYYANGERRTENSKFCLCHDKRAEAQATKLLAARTTQAQEGTLPSINISRVLVSDIADLMFKAMRADKLRKIPESLPAPTRTWRAAQAERVIKEQRARWDNHLEPVFGDRKAGLVTNQELKDYVAARLEAKARHATINLEVALLRRAYRIGFEAQPRRIKEMPTFPKKLAVTPRPGFIEDDVFEKLLPAIAEPGVHGLVQCAFRLGFRRSELLNLLVRQFDDGWLRLFAGATKNGKARDVKLPKDVNEALVACAKNKAPDDYLFTWPDGKRIKDFRGAWEKACTAAGVPELLFHDLRRSAVRRLRKRGVSTATAMQITGHLTRAVFDDYDVANAKDVEQAADKI